MDLTERYEDHHEAIRNALESHQQDIWTALPGIIVSFDPVALTAQVQPALTGLYTGPNLQQKWVNLPVLPDVPVVAPRGGQYAATFPITKGDECVVVFASRCIDNWWSQGGVQTQRELRMHDLSDGLCFVGPWSQKTKIKNWSTTTAQLRTLDGTIYTEVDAPNQKVRLVSGADYIEVDGANNQINMLADTVNITGNVAINLKAPAINEN
jgi:protein gp138